MANLVSDALALMPEHVHLGDRCAWHGTLAACKARGLCAGCKSGDRFMVCSGVCSNNLWPAKQVEVKRDG